MRRALAGLAVIAIAAPVAIARDQAPTVTGKGVGKVKIGKRYSKLRAQGLLGPKVPGCELGGPKTRAAKLKAPLKGFAQLTLDNPRKVESISLGGGAKAKGVGIGSPPEAITAAFPHVKVDHSTDELFESTSYVVPKRDGGKFEFAVDVNTKRVSAIGIPFIATCE